MVEKPVNPKDNARVPQKEVPWRVQLAKASWGAPIIVIMMNGLLSNTRENAWSFMKEAIVQKLSLGLVAVGALAGLLALFGTFKGKGSLILQSLLGVVLSGAILALHLSPNARAALRAEKVDLQGRLEEELAEFRKGLPLMVDDVTELISAETEDGQVFYEYRIVADLGEDFDTLEFAELMVPTLASQQCPEMKTLLAAGFSVHSSYSSRDGRPLAEITITSEVCAEHQVLVDAP